MKYVSERMYSQMIRIPNKLIILVLTFTFLLSAVLYIPCSADEVLRTKFDNMSVQLKVSPVLENGFMLLPLRVTFEQLGGTVDWDNTTQTAKISIQGKLLELQVDSDTAKVNGNAVKLAAPVKKINGNVMVPSSFVSDSLEFPINFDEASNSVVFDTDGIYVSPEEMKQGIEVLKSKVIFENDIRTFTLYAFMNYTGYDDENNMKGFGEVRKLVREELASKNLQLSSPRYYVDKNISYSKYKNALKVMGAAPDFKPIGTIENTSLRDLPQKLKEFYLEADIENMYKKYKPYYDAELEKYKEVCFPAIVRINKYLKVKNEQIPSFYIEVNLLDAYERGSGLGTKDLYRGKGVVITGYSYTPNVMNIVHEYLHGIITPITNKLGNEISRLEYMKGEIKPDSQAAKYYLPDFGSVLDESVIRGLEYKYMNNHDSSYIGFVKNHHGYIFTDYFDERFDEFKDYNGTLEEFIKKLLIEYK